MLSVQGGFKQGFPVVTLYTNLGEDAVVHGLKVKQGSYPPSPSPPPLEGRGFLSLYSIYPCRSITLPHIKQVLRGRGNIISPPSDFVLYTSLSLSLSIILKLFRRKTKEN